MARTKRNIGLIIRRFVLSFIPGIILYEIFHDYHTLLAEDNNIITPKTEMTDSLLNLSVVNTHPNVTKMIEAKTKSPREHIEKHMIFGADSLFKIQSGELPVDDPHLLGYIRRHIFGPSEKQLNISDTFRSDFSQIEQSVFVDFALGYKREGFFVDCGAGDGELFSNTLFFERDRGWSGILIEPHPEDFHTLLSKKRRAYALNACVSPYNHSRLDTLRTASGFISGLKGYVDRLHSGTDFKNNWWYQGDIRVQCFPLYSILLALDHLHVDYLSLDVEGPEIEVLQTIPFDKVTIDVITVEYRAKGQTSDLIIRSMQKLIKVREVIGKTGLYDEIGILPPLKIFNRNQAMQSQEALERTGLDVVFRRTELREKQKT